MQTPAQHTTPVTSPDLQLVRAQKAFLSTIRTIGDYAPGPRNVADLLEQGHRPRNHITAMLLDVLA